MAKLRLRLKQDDQPCRVVPGVFVGGAGAARNLKALRKRGITHIVNAAPTVPCHFADNPEGCFTYLTLHLFDDPEAGGSPPPAALRAYSCLDRSHAAEACCCCATRASRVRRL